MYECVKPRDVNLFVPLAGALAILPIVGRNTASRKGTAEARSGIAGQEAEQQDKKRNSRNEKRNSKSKKRNNSSGKRKKVAGIETASAADLGAIAEERRKVAAGIKLANKNSNRGVAAHRDFPHSLMQNTHSAIIYSHVTCGHISNGQLRARILECAVKAL
jgi:U3 small nucleolar ribonucleoprotein component